MIEFHTVTDTNRFTYNNENETSSRTENEGDNFTHLIRSSGIDADDSGAESRKFDETAGITGVEVSSLEMMTYTFDGRISIIGDFSGRTLNIEV